MSAADVCCLHTSYGNLCQWQGTAQRNQGARHLVACKICKRLTLLLQLKLLFNQTFSWQTPHKCSNLKFNTCKLKQIAFLSNEQEAHGPCAVLDHIGRYCNRSITQLSHTSYMHQSNTKRMGSLPKYIHLQDQWYHMVLMWRSSKLHSIALYSQV